MTQEINRILEDRVSGSVALLESLISALERMLGDPDHHWDHFIDLLNSIRQELGHFAAIENFLESLIRYVSKEGYGPEELLRYISDYRTRWKDSAFRIADRFLYHYAPAGMTLLTHSHSRTIISLLDQLHKREIPFRVLQTLSVPGEEGREALKSMKHLGLEVRLIEDSEVSGALSQTDLVLMGCDALLDDEFLNKTGTRAILKEAGAYQIPRLLITESRKQITRPGWKEGLPENPLFEWVSRQLIDVVLGEG
jgi:translation initiation factor 2B subunit (eIF-2B alpha/beta/delta family)